MYLVMLRHSEDDIPLRLFNDQESAVEFAKTVGEDDGEREKRILSIDATTPICVAIYHFQDGVMESVDVVKDFDGDDD
jgi:hypothetical protein